MTRFAFTTAAVALLLPAMALATQPLPEAKCASLIDFKIPVASIGMPTGGAQVTSVAITTTGSANNRSAIKYCLVQGTIKPVDPKAPDILFAVALPLDWNTKTAMFGGGGFNGSIPKVASNFYNTDAPSPLERGYAVFGSDSGHQTPDKEPGSFLMNEEAFLNWMGDALKKTRDSAFAVIGQAYGIPPSKAYFMGGSTGGREGLLIIGRWPTDWDGVVSLYPARGQVTAILAGQGSNRFLAGPGGWINPAKRGVLFRAALAACDSLDGAADGVISNVKGCNARFDPATAVLDGKPVRCTNGAEAGDACLSDVQIAVLRRINSPQQIKVPLASGEQNYPGHNIYTSDSGIPSDSPLRKMISNLAMGDAPPTYPVTPGMSLSATFRDNYIRYGVARDPSLNPLTFDPDKSDRFAPRLSEMSKLDAADKDLTAFAAHGGKLIIMHGTADLIVSPRLSEDYYDRLQKTMGRDKVASFVRFYEVAGFGHAISTNFSASWDYLSALENWVEKEADPAEGEVVTDTIGVPGRTRPLCLYPKWPKYKGSGDVNKASSFACALQ